MNSALQKNRGDPATPSRVLSLLALMKRFHPYLFLRVMELLGDSRLCNGWLNNFPAERDTTVFDEDHKISYDEMYTNLENSCIELELTASRVSIKKIRDELAKPICVYKNISSLELELSSRLTDEMSEISFFSLSLSESEYFENPIKKWEKIIERFPDSVIDVEEASKCFSLSRYAASVFHSTQLIEIGLLELGKFIHVADPKSGWTAVANELNKIIKKKYDDRTLFEQQNFAFLEQIQGTVEALKNAWRNKIGHAQGRLTLMSKDFSPEIAEEILFASRAFMRRLADGLPPIT